MVTKTTATDLATPPPISQPGFREERPETPAPTKGAPSEGEATQERMEQTLAAAEAALEEARRHGDLAPSNIAPSTPERQAAYDSDSATRLKVSVLMPVYNERETIREIISQVRNQGLHHELVIVDDCSTDGTRDLLIEIEQQCEEVRVILHGYNRGKGAALRTALGHARGDIVIVQDADLEYSPADFSRLIEPIQRGEADVVYGSRFRENAQQDPSWLHRLGNRMLTMASNLTTGLQLTDMETCYKAIRRGALRGMVLRENRFGFEPEITAKLARRGARFQEVAIQYNSRGWDEGKKIGMKDALRALWCILRYAWVD